MPLRTNRTERKRLSTDFKATAQSSQRVPVIRGFFTLRFAKPEHEEEFLIEHFRALFPLHMIIMLIAAIAIWACVAAQCKPSPSPALRVSMFPGSAVRLAVHFFLTPKMGFRVHHRVHVVMSTLPFLARNVQAFRAHLGYQGGPSDGFDLDFHELSRIGVTGQVTAMAFFPIFMYLHPTAFLPRMWLIANFAICQSFSHARTREDTVAGLLMVTIGVVLGQILELHMRRMHQARLEIEAAAEDARRADSRLNHLLKNKSAEANYLIESVTDRLCAMSGDHEMDALLDDLAKVCAQREEERAPSPSLLILCPHFSRTHRSNSSTSRPSTGPTCASSSYSSKRASTRRQCRRPICNDCCAASWAPKRRFIWPTLARTFCMLMALFYSFSSRRPGRMP